uniref:RMI1_N domain-containing protein n=1 Tax=Heligmosomoides polygyrus TaxID=6339 RepID=A0A183GJG9_HELPZ
LTESYEPLTKVPVVALKAVIVKPMIFQVRNYFSQYCECISNNDDLSWFHGDDEENSQKSVSELHLTNPGGRRLLKLELTDGQNVVHAIEYGGKGPFILRDGSDRSDKAKHIYRFLSGNSSTLNDPSCTNVSFVLSLPPLPSLPSRSMSRPLALVYSCSAARRGTIGLCYTSVTLLSATVLRGLLRTA